MKPPVWTKKELQTQDPSESSSGQPAPRIRFVPDERIELIREVANSREERDRLRAELESQGFTVMVQETSTPPVGGEYYTATLLAEKRETVMVDTWAVERDKLAQRKRDKKIDLTAKLGFWIAIALALIGLLYVLGPLIHAVRALF